MKKHTIRSSVWRYRFNIYQKIQLYRADSDEVIEQLAKKDHGVDLEIDKDIQVL